MLIAILALGLDLGGVGFHQWYDVRLALALISFATLMAVRDGNTETLGLRLTPIQGWRPWLGWSFRIGIAVTFLIVASFAVWHSFGNELPIYTTSPTHLARQFINACLLAPVLEETVYRFFVFVAFAPLIGCRYTVVISGLIFGMLHVLYGNPSPENLCGGFFLAWAFYKSESIVVPFMLHSVGNGLVVIGQVGGWYFMNQPV
ncbi:MAG: membrane protease YdiL (CAAX protease family) [Planctomycetaceae bacterium]